MHLIGIEVNLHFYNVMSLKEKRRIINSILDQVKHKYEISVAEVNYHDDLGRGALGFGMVTNSLQFGEKILQKVINFLDTVSEIEITKIEWVDI